MNRNEFLDKLEKNLRGLPKADIEDTLFDYSEHFTIGFSKGRSEEEIAKSLGDPITLAKQIKATNFIQSAQDKSSVRNITKAGIACIGLGVVNIIFIVPLIALVLAVVGVLIASGVVVVASLIALIASAFSQDLYSSLHMMGNRSVNIFLSLGTLCFGILLSIATCWILDLFYKYILKYLKWNLKAIIGKESV